MGPANIHGQLIFAWVEVSFENCDGGQIFFSMVGSLTIWGL